MDAPNLFVEALRSRLLLPQAKPLPDDQFAAAMASARKTGASQGEMSSFIDDYLSLSFCGEISIPDAYWESIVSFMKEAPSADRTAFFMTAPPDAFHELLLVAEKDVELEEKMLMDRSFKWSYEDIYLETPTVVQYLAGVPSNEAVLTSDNFEVFSRIWNRLCGPVLQFRMDLLMDYPFVDGLLEKLGFEPDPVTIKKPIGDWQNGEYYPEDQYEFFPYGERHAAMANPISRKMADEALVAGEIEKLDGLSLIDGYLDYFRGIQRRGVDTLLPG